MTKALIKQNDCYYSFLQSNYNSITKQYDPIENTGTNLEEYYADVNSFTESITIGGETFKPVDKFNDFQIVFSKPCQCFINGNKSFSDLVIMSHDLDVSIASEIKTLLVNFNKNNSELYLIFSIDKGMTWNTWKNNCYEKLNVSIPHVQYSDQNKQDWLNAKNIVMEQGIPVADFNNLDINTLKANFIRFAFVINKSDYLSIASINNVSWKVDKKGYASELKDGEYDLSVLTRNIRIVSHINNDFITVNVIT